MKIVISEDQLIKIISEQDDTYGSFVRSGGFRNCRGVRLRIFGGDDGGEGRLSQYKDDWDEIANPKYHGDEKEGYKEFRKNSGLNIDFEYYLGVKTFYDRLRSYNSGNRYGMIFNNEGKPFTKETTQSNVNNIETMFVNGAAWYFYFRDVFGNKTPTFVEIYNYIESIGGKEKLKQMVNDGFNAKGYKDKLSNNVQEYNNILMQKFPFEKPAGKTNFYIMWEEQGVNKARYFNTFEEWKFSVEALKVEGNVGNVSEDGAATEGSVLYKSKPRGEITNKIF